MTVEDSRAVLLSRLALLCALLVVAIIGVSAFIRLSGAGLGCSPWPQCYGHIEQVEQHGLLQTAISPTSTEITIARFAHRVLAVLLLPMMLLLVAGGFAAKSKPWSYRWEALSALGLVLFLAVLGRWTAGSRVPVVILGNLMGGFLLFALCLRMAGSQLFSVAADKTSAVVHVWVLGAIALLVTQIISGGFVSSTYAGLSCPDLSGCVMPTNLSWDVFNPLRQPTVNSAGWPVNAEVALVHGMHRWIACGAVIVICGAAMALWGNGRRALSLMLLVLTGTQLMLGVLLVGNALPLTLAVAHNLVAALMLALLLVGNHRSHRPD